MQRKYFISIFSYTIIFKTILSASRITTWLMNRPEVSMSSLSNSRASTFFLQTTQPCQEAVNKSIAGDLYKVDCENMYVEKSYHDQSDASNFGEHYWKIYFPFVETSVTIGLTNRHNIIHTNGTRCLCYDGDITNGEHVLISNFGPKIGSRDTAGIYIKFRRQQLHVHFYLNGNYLGQAFDIPMISLSNPYPLIRFGTHGTVIVAEQSPVGFTTLRHTDMFLGYQGLWKFACLLERNDTETYKLYPCTTRRLPKLYIQQTQSALTMTAQIVKNNTFTLHVTDNGWHTGVNKESWFNTKTELTCFVKNLILTLRFPDSIFVEHNNLTFSTHNMTSIWRRGTLPTRRVIYYD